MVQPLGRQAESGRLAGLPLGGPLGSAPVLELPVLVPLVQPGRVAELVRRERLLVEQRIRSLLLLLSLSALLGDGL